jgi:hypothetical protein
VEKQTRNSPKTMVALSIQIAMEELCQLRKENKVLRDSADMARMAISNWKELPLKKRFDLVEMISALSEVEAAINYVGLVLEGEAASSPKKDLLQMTGTVSKD